MSRKSPAKPKSRRFTLYRAQTAPAATAAAPRELVEVSLLLERRKPLPPVKPGQHLTHEALRKTYGAPAADLQTVRKFAAENGLTVVEEDARLQAMSSSVRLSGSLEDVRRAFDVEDLGFHQVGTRNLLSHTGAVRLPAELRGIVRGVIGLDESIQVERHMAARPHLAPAKPKASGRRKALTAGQEDRVYTVPEIARLYDFPERRGEGQCIGVIELFGGFKQEDMEQYFSGTVSGAPLKCPEFEVVGTNAPGQDVVSDMEVAMDLQIVGSVCNDARIVVYLQSGTPQPPTLKTFFDVLRSAVFDEENRPSVLSISWGYSENTDQLRQDWAEAFDELLQIAAHLGITVVSSCGDQGSFAPPLTDSSASWSPAVFVVSSNPYVLACGGTTLQAQDGAITSEVVWNRLGDALQIQTWMTGNPTPNVSTLGMATGGGVSRLWKRPEYQAHAQVPLAASYVWANGMLSRKVPFAGRGVPDVAAVADLRTGVQFVYDGQWVVGGGTSASAPIWASLVLLLNESLSRESGQPVRLGWFNPTLYRLQLEEKADVLRPITQGGNGGFSASAESPWSACAGLGSPKGRTLEAALLRQARSMQRVR
jgi:kumamolisin